MTATLAPLPFEEAIKAFARRGQQLRTTDSWRDMWKAEHAAAFTVARSAGFDVLKDIHAAMLSALAEGKTFEAFSKELRPVLQAKGWWGRQRRGDGTEVQLGSTRRLRLIYDTNMRVSHAAGRWEQIQRTKKLLPYLRYSAVLDTRTRPAHRHWHGTVLPVDEAWWRDHYPPNGWNCRCTVVQLTKRQAEKAGITSPVPSAPPRRWFNPSTGQTEDVPAGIDPGWDYNPGAAAYAANPAGTAAQQLLAKTVNAPPALAARAATPAVTRDLAAAFLAWFDGLDRTKWTGERQVVGTLSPAVLAALGRTAAPAESGAITVTDRVLAHMQRDSKRDALRAIPAALLKRLPEHLARPRAVLRDKRDGALVYVFDDPSNPAARGKIILRLDFREAERVGGGIKRQVVGNAIRSGGIVDAVKLADPTFYVVLVGSVM